MIDENLLMALVAGGELLVIPIVGLYLITIPNYFD